MLWLTALRDTVCQFEQVAGSRLTPPAGRHRSIGRLGKCRIFRGQLIQKCGKIGAEVQPQVGLGIDRAQPAAARFGRLLAFMEAEIAPERLDHVRAHVADVVRGQQVEAIEAQDPRQRVPKADVAQMADVELLVGVRLRILHHHPIGLPRSMPILPAGVKYRPDHFATESLGIEEEVDVSVDRFDTRVDLTVVEAIHHLLRDRLGALADHLLTPALGLLLGHAGCLGSDRLR